MLARRPVSGRARSLPASPHRWASCQNCIYRKKKKKRRQMNSLFPLIRPLLARRRERHKGRRGLLCERCRMDVINSAAQCGPCQPPHALPTPTGRFVCKSPVKSGRFTNDSEIFSAAILGRRQCSCALASAASSTRRPADLWKFAPQSSPRQRAGGITQDTLSDLRGLLFQTPCDVHTERTSAV